MEVVEEISEEQPRVRGQYMGIGQIQFQSFVVAGAFPVIENSRACRSDIERGQRRGTRQLRGTRTAYDLVER
jgi:hypothetical protein